MLPVNFPSTLMFVQVKSLPPSGAGTLAEVLWRAAAVNMPAARTTARSSRFASPEIFLSIWGLYSLIVRVTTEAVVAVVESG